MILGNSAGIKRAGTLRPRLCMCLTKRLHQLSFIYSYLSSQRSEPTRNGEHGSHRTPIREVPHDSPHVALGEVSPRWRGDERAHETLIHQHESRSPRRDPRPHRRVARPRECGGHRRIGHRQHAVNDPADPLGLFVVDVAPEHPGEPPTGQHQGTAGGDLLLAPLGRLALVLRVPIGGEVHSPAGAVLDRRADTDNSEGAAALLRHGSSLSLLSWWGGGRFPAPLGAFLARWWFLPWGNIFRTWRTRWYYPP